MRYFVYLACLLSICCSSTNLEGWLFSQPPKHVQLEKKQNEVLEKFATTLAQKHGMKFLLRGLGHLVDQKETRAGFSFIDGRELTIEQGRPIAVSMIYAFCCKFNNDPLFKTWKIMQESPRFYYLWAFGMKISFWNKDYDRPLAPKLSQIRFIEDKINYYYASAKDQSLELIHSEPIEEAIKIVNKPPCEPTNE
jgi:hypothetical protein